MNSRKQNRKRRRRHESEPRIRKIRKMKAQTGSTFELTDGILNKRIRWSKTPSGCAEAETGGILFDRPNLTSQTNESSPSLSGCDVTCCTENTDLTQHIFRKLREQTCPEKSKH